MVRRANSRRRRRVKQCSRTETECRRSLLRRITAQLLQVLEPDVDLGLKYWTRSGAFRRRKNNPLQQPPFTAFDTHTTRKKATMGSKDPLGGAAPISRCFRWVTIQYWHAEGASSTKLTTNAGMSAGKRM
ncbi:hypothetical protein PM082_013882 [Marasmius tenuissimus]|nr:hypothetical protein PM082_013882 [Marasmius tenuissimus]